MRGGRGLEAMFKEYRRNERGGERARGEIEIREDSAGSFKSPCFFH